MAVTLPSSSKNRSKLKPPKQTAANREEALCRHGEQKQNGKAKEIVSRRALSYARIVIVEESDLLHGKE